MATLLNRYQVAPPPAVNEQMLPLTFFDINWLPFHPIRRLLFYHLPSCSKPDFIETVVPKLQIALSTTLKHYSPLAGKIFYPLNPEERPFLRYVQGDSVPLSVYESFKEFDALVGDFPRDADQFYDFIPQLPPVGEETDHKTLQVLAIQVTLFPNRGICIGIANHHSAGDATSIVGFLKSWASINKQGEDEGEPVVVFDKSLVKDSRDVGSINWNHVRRMPFVSSTFPVPTNRVRATYALQQSEINKLKDSILTRNLHFSHPSSFVVAAAYVWSCLAKSLVLIEDEVAEDEPEFFLFSADSRSRIDPPLPTNYFGNCLVHGLAKVPHGKLVGDDGFFSAAEAIAEQITNKINNRDAILKDAANSMSEIGSVIRRRILSVSGSARVDIYGVDFGWGEVRKMETLSIDGQKYSMSLCRSSVGGLEIGMSLPAAAMKLFGSTFVAGKVV